VEAPIIKHANGPLGSIDDKIMTERDILMRASLPLALIYAATGSAGFPSVISAQTPISAPAAPSPYTYADLADLATNAPITLHGAIRSASQIRADQAPGLAAGHARFFVESDIISLIRGVGPLASRVQYLVDLPLTADGRAPKLKKKQPVLIFAQPVATSLAGSHSTNAIRLIAPDAQLPWDPATDSQVRTILGESVRKDAPPAITGIANGFHVPGTLPGEGETQLFLDTRTGEPVSITITMAADGSRQWSAAFGEVMDENHARPRTGTLGWYRLACGLPRMLPIEKLGGTAAEDRRRASADYTFVLRELGQCVRTRKAPPAAQ
jgi:hypothetical protein